MSTRAQLRFEVRRKLGEVSAFRTEALTGTVTIVATGGAATPTLVTGSGTAFLSESGLEIGSEIYVGGEIRQVARIDSDTVLYVNTGFESDHTAAAWSLLTRRIWADEQINGELDTVLQQLHAQILNGAPEALRTRVLANLPATRTTTLPATLGSVAAVEVLFDSVSGDYTPLRCLSDEQWAGGLPRTAWSGWAGIGITTGNGTPTAYRWIDASTIEFDVTPPQAVTNGMRWVGFLAAPTLATEAATLGTLPDPTHWEEAIVHAATASLLALDATQWQRSVHFDTVARQQTKELLARFQRGRQAGFLMVNMVR